MIYVFSIGVRELFFFLSNVESEQFKQFISPYINYQLLIDIQNSISSAQYGELLSQQGASFVSQTSGILLDYFGILGGALINSFIVIVVSYYLLKDGEKFVTKLSERFDVSPIVHKFISNIDSDFQTIFFGNLLNALLTASIGIFSFLLLELFFVPSPALSIKYPVLIGLLCGIGSLIPIVGMKIVYFPVALYIGFQSFRLPGVSPLYPIIFFSVSAVIVDGIPDLVLRPYISSGDLHLGLVMLSYIIGPLLFGWYGLFFGPMLLVIITHFSITIIPYLINKNRTLSEFN
jgi:predicted PurR-regulated permease PerM